MPRYRGGDMEPSGETLTTFACNTRDALRCADADNGVRRTEAVKRGRYAPEVGVYTVRSQALTLTTDLPGRTSAYRVAEVRPQVSGILEKRSFVEGAEVKLGQQLYQIDPRTYEARLRRAEANRTTAENLARRYETLLQTKAVSKQQYDDALAAWKQAEADYQVARIDVQYTRVLSPISGRIGRSAVTEGRSSPMDKPNRWPP